MDLEAIQNELFLIRQELNEVRDLYVCLEDAALALLRTLEAYDMIHELSLCDHEVGMCGCEFRMVVEDLMEKLNVEQEDLK